MNQLVTTPVCVCVCVFACVCVSLYECVVIERNRERNTPSSGRLVESNFGKLSGAPECVLRHIFLYFY